VQDLTWALSLYVQGLGDKRCYFLNDEFKKSCNTPTCHALNNFMCMSQIPFVTEARQNNNKNRSGVLTILRMTVIYPVLCLSRVQYMLESNEIIAVFAIHLHF
jgi:hypothetical protein